MEHRCPFHGLSLQGACGVCRFWGKPGRAQPWVWQGESPGGPATLCAPASPDFSYSLVVGRGVRPQGSPGGAGRQIGISSLLDPFACYRVCRCLSRGDLCTQQCLHLNLDTYFCAEVATTIYPVAQSTNVAVVPFPHFPRASPSNLFFSLSLTVSVPSL